MSQVAAGPLSRDQVVEAIQVLRGTVESWRANESAPQIPFAGGLVKAPDQAIEIASMRLIQLCDVPMVEDDAMPLVLAVDRWEDELTAWAKGRRDAPSTTNPSGSHAMWDAFEQLERDCTPRQDTIPEPVSALLSAGVNPAQVARTYGFFENGEPSIRMVFEERDKPGTHYDQATWRSPAYRNYLAKIRKRFEARSQRVGRFAEMVESAEAMAEIRETAKKAKPPTPEAPEPLDQLIRDGVPVAQILRMKPKETEESVYTRASELGVALDPSGWSYANRTRTVTPPHQQAEQQAAYDQAMEAAQVNTYPELGDAKARILAMHGDGMSGNEIAAFIHKEYGLSRQKVQGIIREAKAHGQEAGAGAEHG